MCEKMQEQKIEKIKASSVDVIVERINGKPYYSIKYFDLSENQGYIGFGSYYLDYVFEWKDKYFDIVEEDKECKNIISNDLISRRALMEEIDSLYMSITGLRAGKGVILKIMEEYKKSVLKCIDEQPTAYDVDAVCEELDKASDYYETDEQGKEHVQMVNLTDAIEIVRNGGKKE